MEKVCQHCGQTFATHPAVSYQKFCGNRDCQRERKRRWQRKKMAQDQDYRENKAAAQKDWLRRNPHYWRNYRKRNPAAVEKNRCQQRKRNQQRLKPQSIIAKKDELEGGPVLLPGIYRLTLQQDGMIAKKDELLIQISSISRV